MRCLHSGKPEIRRSPSLPLSSEVVFGEPIYVPSDASDADMERMREMVTAALNAVTEKAYRLVDGVQ